MDTAVVALQTTVMGMGTVFLVLTLIALIIEYVLQRGFGQRDRVEEKAEISEVLEEKEEEITPEIVAAISAAIAASGYATRETFVIRRIRRADSAWVQAGREEIMKRRRFCQLRKEKAWR